VVVVPSRCGRFRHVGLHAHVEDVAGVACDTAEEASEGGEADQAREGERFGFGWVVRVLRGCEAQFEVFVDAEADGGVG
jgi:hypothetical protein